MPVARTPAPLTEQFRAALTATPQNGPVGLAVSGGGDSIAMMHLAARNLGADTCHVITVNHGLREEAAAECAFVAAEAAALGLPHTVADWHWDKQGNLQASARAGRWALIADWAHARQIPTVWMGHTEDDQVETMLLRLARGSGIDGLAAMYPVSQRDGLQIFRPLLKITRSDLRDWMQGEGITWRDDPSNDDPRFDRVRARQMMVQLADLGLTRKRLLQTVDHMQAAHLSLQKAALDFARAHVRQDAGDLLFDAAAVDLESADAPRRVMAAGFQWIAGRTYRPRFDALQEAVGKASKGMTVTLGGCLISPDKSGCVRLTREAAATGPVTRNPALDAQGVIWDGRWYLSGPLGDSLHFAALGDGIKNCPDWRASGMPRASLLASPAVWDGDTLVAAPVAGYAQGWSARIVADFHHWAFAIED
ncbi:MAG: tRNA lysidine(34) synthetase TilS [Pseudomonadota bacterium]